MKNWFRLQTLLRLAGFLAAAGLGAQSGGQPPLFSLHVSPAMDIPLGDSLTLYRFVGGGALSAEYRMPFFPVLYVDGGLGYTFYQIRNAAAAEQSLSLVSAGIGLGLQFTLLPRLAARLFFDGGYSYGFSNDFTKPQ